MKLASFKVFPENEITFSYVPKKHLKSKVQLTNTSDELLAFKMKTNVPICYLVKPHIGCLQPHSTLEISITMQPTDYNPQTASISDKFLINVVPLPPNTDPTTLSDPSRFQQIWDSAPKSQVQAHKLKVGLRFEGESANTSVLDKTADDTSRQVTSDNRASTLRNSTAGEGSFLESRDDLGRSSMMQSFSMDPSSTNMRSSNVEQSNLSVLASQQTAPKIEQPAAVSVEKKKDVVEERKGVESKGAPRTFDERIALLEKRIEESENDKRSLNQRCQEMIGKAEDQKRLLFDLSEENARLKSELGNLKSSTFKNKPANKEGQDAGGYQFWHILLALIVGLIMGAYLSS